MYNFLFLDCKDLVAYLSNNTQHLEKSCICTGSPEDHKASACSGDSGGPLITREGDKTTLVGIISWVFFPCGATHFAPSVYTRVSAFIDFIELYVKQNTQQENEMYFV